MSGFQWYYCKYCPAAVAVPTTKGHMTQVRQGVRSTKPKGIVTKPQPENKEPEPDGMEPSDNDSGNNLIVKLIDTGEGKINW